MKIPRAAYVGLYGPTTGDRVRLGDTGLLLEVERDYATYGEEVTFGGGKVIRDGQGQSQVPRAEGAPDLVITNAIVLDYWANVGAGQLEKTLPPFVDALRKKFPKVPIILLGPYYTILTGNSEDKIKVESDFTADRQKAGDTHIRFVDMTTVISREKAYALVDGTHCNTLGFELMANGLEGPLAEDLGLKKK